MQIYDELQDLKDITVKKKFVERISYYIKEIKLATKETIIISIINAANRCINKALFFIYNVSLNSFNIKIIS